MGLSTANNITLYKDTTISGHLDVGKVLTQKRFPGVSDTHPLTIINESLGDGTGVVCQSTASGQGFHIAYMIAQSSVSWVEGVNWGSSNEFTIKSGSNGLTLKPTGGAVLSGKLDVGQDQAQTSIKPYVSHAGHQGNVETEATWDTRGYINFDTTASDGLLFLATQDVIYMNCGLDIVCFYKPTTNASDGRLKEIEELIGHACGTLSKLRPQLYDKKPDIENDGNTTWYKESGLIAQEIYYDAPELRHLVHRGKPELDEEDSSLPLPEIPTSIDPQRDTGYSSWGKDTTSVNYIGLIAYLVKADTELHDGVKVLEPR